MDFKNFKRLLISVPKCLELNSELILVWVYTREPDPICTFLGGNFCILIKTTPICEFWTWAWWNG